MCKKPFLTLVFACSSLLVCLSASADQGITASTIRIGGVMDLEGRSSGLGQGMKRGIEAAIEGERINGREIEFLTLNDSYTPSKTMEGVNELIQEDIFAMLGNVGTPTAKVSLPILAENGVPAIGFFTGAGILRPGVGDIINFRASYVQETAAVINQALAAGINSKEICAFVQNDAYGMAGVVGIKRALDDQTDSEMVIEALDEILAFDSEDPPRNGIGPVGVYKRNTFTSKDGYESLKVWEENQNVTCRLVVTVGTYNAIAHFAAYSRYKGNNWVISAVSFTGADNFGGALSEFDVSNGILMTQVVPLLNSDLPIVEEARDKLGADFGYVTLEGFIVGKMWLYQMNEISGSLSRQKYISAVQGGTFELGGLSFDFSDDNQGSDLVSLTYLKEGDWQPMRRRYWSQLLEGKL